MEQTGLKVIEETGVQPDSFMSVIERLASRPDIDPAKIQQFMDMQEHILDRNAEQAFNAAMMRVQNKIPTILKGKENTDSHSTYAPLEDILKIIKPIYTAEGFSLMFYEGDTPKESHIRIMVDVMHEQGHTKTRFRDIPVDNVGMKGAVNKTLVHAGGSSASYGRRYLTCMIFNVPTGDDDDGNAAGKRPEFISQDQQTDINDKLKEFKIPTDRFYNYVSKALKGDKITSVDKIPSKDGYRYALAAIEAGKTALKMPSKETPK
jgi:hypothetical protein